MPASRAPAALTATIVLLATLIAFSFFSVLAVADFSVAVVVGIGIGIIALLIAWGVRGA